MTGLAAPFLDNVMHGLAGNLVVTFELTLGKVPGGQSTGFVDYVDQDICAVGFQTLADLIVYQSLGKCPVGIFEGIGVGNLDFIALRVDGNKFYLLGSHHRTQTASAV